MDTTPTAPPQQIRPPNGPLSDARPVRLPVDAVTDEDIRAYYTTRARQLAHDGYLWSGHLIPVGEAALRTHFVKDGRVHHSVFVRATHRGQGWAKHVFAPPPPGERFVTTVSCALAPYFEAHDLPYVLAAPLLESIEYQQIAAFYGDRTARRSGVFLMNHIDEGLTVLSSIGASDQAKRAFCLHPLVQSDEECAAHIAAVAAAQATVSDGAHVLALAMEYRSVANAHLSFHERPAQGIRLSPLKDVNDMLIADKVQNRRDFQRFHAATHPRAARLAAYFDEWLVALGVFDRARELAALLD